LASPIPLRQIRICCVSPKKKCRTPGRALSRSPGGPDRPRALPALFQNVSCSELQKPGGGRGRSFHLIRAVNTNHAHSLTHPPLTQVARSLAHTPARTTRSPPCPASPSARPPQTPSLNSPSGPHFISSPVSSEAADSSLIRPLPCTNCRFNVTCFAVSYCLV
jgi:hypothetical protein